MAQVAHIQLVHAPGQGGDKLRSWPVTWIEIQLLGEDDSPIPEEKYRVVLPDGVLQEGKLDAEGLAKLEEIPSGNCKICFPDLDEEAWEEITTQEGTSG